MYMNKILPLFLILLSGCTAIPKYNYQSQANTDPTIIFGDRFGRGSVNSPARSFAIDAKDAVLNKCADFEVVGTTSNHWMKLNSPTIQIKTPAGKELAIRGNYVYSSGTLITTCAPPVLMFLPKEAATYSVDIETANNKCVLSIVQKLPDGQQEKVDGTTVLPGCRDK